ncbi:hypothetical protein Lal_00041062 [Lupinus albus]|nr:hypothetical protein Lal_00041062 [Lupinus albus]
MTNVGKALKAELAQHFTLERPEVVSRQVSRDGTRKWLLRMAPTNPHEHNRGAEIECVYIPGPDRGTLCVSSQVGCTLTCSFCHTGTQRLVRNLSSAEIVQQLVVARDELGDWTGQMPSRDASGGGEVGRLVTNIVFMGMGEPLYNFDAVVAAVGVMSDQEGSACPGGGSPSPPPASCRRSPASGGGECDARDLPPRRSGRSARRVGAPEPQVSDPRPPRGLPRLSGPEQRPAHHLRICDAEGRQRFRCGCAGTGAAAQGHPGQDQPDPVQSLAGQPLRMLRLGADRAFLGDRVQRRLRLAGAHPARPGHPRRLRPAQERDREAARPCPDDAGGWHRRGAVYRLRRGLNQPARGRAIATTRALAATQPAAPLPALTRKSLRRPWRLAASPCPTSRSPATATTISRIASGGGGRPGPPGSRTGHRRRPAPSWRAHLRPQADGREGHEDQDRQDRPEGEAKEDAHNPSRYAIRVNGATTRPPERARRGPVSPGGRARSRPRIRASSGPRRTTPSGRCCGSPWPTMSRGRAMPRRWPAGSASNHRNRRSAGPPRGAGRPRSPPGHSRHRLASDHPGRVEAEDEDVVRADMVLDLDVGAVQRADRQRAVEGELHVAGARGFETRRRDLLRQVGRRDDRLREAHRVVRQEHHLQAARHLGVVVHRPRHVGGELDDQLRLDVARRRLAGEDLDAGRPVPVRLGLDRLIERHRLEDIEQLALVLVDALHLHIEERVGIDVDSRPVGDDSRQGFLALPAHGPVARHEARILREPIEAGEQFGIVEDALAQGLDGEAGEARIGRVQPAAEGDAVGLVDDLVRIEGVQIREDRGAHQVGVKGRDAVHPPRAVEGEMAHPHPAAVRFIDQRDRGEVGGIALARLALLLEVHPVDQVDDLHVARQQPLHQLHRPRLQGLRQEGVVRVVQGVGGDVPRILPGEAMVIGEEAHQLRHGDGRMGVVELDRGVVGQGAQVAAFGLVARHEVLQRGRGEEVFLAQAQFLPLGGGIARVEHAGDRLGAHPLLEGAHMVAAVEPGEVDGRL